VWLCRLCNKVLPWSDPRAYQQTSIYRGTRSGYIEASVCERLTQVRLSKYSELNSHIKIPASAGKMWSFQQLGHVRFPWSFARSLLRHISPKNFMHSGVSFKIFCAELTYQNSGKFREDVVISTARVCSIRLKFCIECLKLYYMWLAHKTRCTQVCLLKYYVLNLHIKIPASTGKDYVQQKKHNHKDRAQQKEARHQIGGSRMPLQWRGGRNWGGRWNVYTCWVRVPSIPQLSPSVSSLSRYESRSRNDSYLTWCGPWSSGVPSTPKWRRHLGLDQSGGNNTVCASCIINLPAFIFRNMCGQTV
jgi:hypothetical protein